MGRSQFLPQAEVRRKLTSANIDVLAAAIRDGSNDKRFDMNEDELVNESDMNYIVETVFKTKTGDSDLDGDVDFADFLVLSGNFGKADMVWAQGNFDLTPEITIDDFLALSLNFDAND